MSSLDVFGIGSPVSLSGDDDFIGTVTAICIRGNGVTYEVVWWDGRTRKSEWLNGYEMTSKAKKMRIGFHSAADDEVRRTMDALKPKAG